MNFRLMWFHSFCYMQLTIKNITAPLQEDESPCFDRMERLERELQSKGLGGKNRSPTLIILLIVRICTILQLIKAQNLLWVKVHSRTKGDY